jgi:hypothetical protein
MWAGPSTDPETGGLASTQNDWVELGLTYCFLIWGRAGRGPANWAGLRQVQPKAT